MSYGKLEFSIIQSRVEVTVYMTNVWAIIVKVICLRKYMNIN